jgi:hypothetical protein
VINRPTKPTVTGEKVSFAIENSRPKEQSNKPLDFMR